jgi:hypothetical protein
MAKNKMADLRNHLFETIEALKDEEKPMALDRAHAISEIAQTLINSAKVEVDLAKAIGALPCSEFFHMLEESRDLPDIPDRHRIAAARKVG